ncbi:hypothetical protein PIB30_115243, partial [Stylosanthes scabra]|nr:hypothetical protein [Stylosanthes scabra]
MRRTERICVEGKPPPNIFKAMHMRLSTAPMRESGASELANARIRVTPRTCVEATLMRESGAS